MSEPVDLDGIEARANAATDRPYSHLSGGSAEQRSRDAEFIVGARDDVLALVAEVRALRAANARLNRRAQIAESAINELTSTTGRGKTRAVAAEVWERCQRSHENVFHRSERAEAALRDIVMVLGPERICECRPDDGECGLRDEAADALATARAALAAGPGEEGRAR